QSRRHSSGRLEELCALHLGRLGKRRLDELSYDTEGELALELGTARPEHAHLGLHRGCTSCCDESRLADPGGALDPDERAAAPTSLPERRLDPCQLRASLEQGFPGSCSVHLC